MNWYFHKNVLTRNVPTLFITHIKQQQQQLLSLYYIHLVNQCQLIVVLIKSDSLPYNDQTTAVPFGLLGLL